MAIHEADYLRCSLARTEWQENIKRTLLSCEISLHRRKRLRAKPLGMTTGPGEPLLHFSHRRHHPKQIRDWNNLRTIQTIAHPRTVAYSSWVYRRVRPSASGDRFLESTSWAMRRTLARWWHNVGSRAIQMGNERVSLGGRSRVWWPLGEGELAKEDRL